jgi:hypothetical protein
MQPLKEQSKGRKNILSDERMCLKSHSDGILQKAKPKSIVVLIMLIE